MTDVVASVTASPAGDRLVAKIDAEGAECEIVLQTPVEVWQSVDEVFIEFHDFAGCSQTRSSTTWSVQASCSSTRDSASFTSHARPT